tara:strand:+ start:319 stop:588 length:270 start_codon:yes stop_codon:yes gene_type:complete
MNRYDLTKVDRISEWRTKDIEHTEIQKQYYPIRDKIVSYVKNDELSILNHRIVNLMCLIESIKTEWNSYHDVMWLKLQELLAKRKNFNA